MIHKDNLSKVFSLHIPPQDIQLLQEAIHTHLENHQFSAPDRWAEFAITAVSDSPYQTDDNEIRTALDQATQYYDQLYITPEITDSSIPLLTRIKQSFHQLTLFYVNKLGEKQTRFNDRILRVVNPVAQKQAEQEAEIAALKEQIAQLQQTIAEMEQKA